jgi:spore coat protein U-like protein
MILFCQAASAATDSIPAAITALVPAACDIAADGVSFGVYTGKQVDVESTISISCTRTTGWNIGLNAGLGPDATVNARKLVRGTSTMSYGLFSDTAKTVNWGETIGGDTVSGTGTGTAQTVTVYARLPCGQFVKPGAYFDTIVATITY